MTTLEIQLKSFRKWLFETYENDSTFGEMLCDDNLVDAYLEISNKNTKSFCRCFSKKIECGPIIRNELTCEKCAASFEFNP